MSECPPFSLRTLKLLTVCMNLLIKTVFFVAFYVFITIWVVIKLDLFLHAFILNFKSFHFD